MKMKLLIFLIITALVNTSVSYANQVIRSIDCNKNGKVVICRHILDEENKILATQIELYNTIDNIKEKKFTSWTPAQVTLTGKTVINDTRFINNTLLARYGRRQTQYCLDGNTFRSIRPDVPKYDPTTTSSDYKEATSGQYRKIIFKHGRRNLIFYGITQAHITTLTFNIDATLLAAGFSNGTIEIHSVKELQKKLNEFQGNREKRLKLETKMSKVSLAIYEEEKCGQSLYKNTKELNKKLKFLHKEYKQIQIFHSMIPLYSFYTNKGSKNANASIAAIKFSPNNELVIGRINGKIDICDLAYNSIQTKNQQNINLLSYETLIKQTIEECIPLIEQMLTIDLENELKQTKIETEQIIERIDQTEQTEQKNINPEINLHTTEVNNSLLCDLAYSNPQARDQQDTNLLSYDTADNESIPLIEQRLTTELENEPKQAKIENEPIIEQIDQPEQLERIQISQEITQQTNEPNNSSLRDLAYNNTQTKSQQNTNLISDGTTDNECVPRIRRTLAAEPENTLEQAKIENEQIDQADQKKQTNTRPEINQQAKKPNNSSFFSSFNAWWANNRTLCLWTGTGITLCCAITLALKYKLFAVMYGA